MNQSHTQLIDVMMKERYVLCFQTRFSLPAALCDMRGQRFPQVSFWGYYLHLCEEGWDSGLPVSCHSAYVISDSSDPALRICVQSSTTSTPATQILVAIIFLRVRSCCVTIYGQSGSQRNVPEECSSDKNTQHLGCRPSIAIPLHSNEN